MSSPPLTPWAARLLRRATKADAVYGTCIVLLAVLSVWSGRAAAHRLSPAGASSASLLLDELDLPGALPNAALTRDDGVTTRLHELTREPRTIVTFYAPWCGPCQEELPVLVRGTSRHPGRLAVVVGADRGGPGGEAKARQPRAEGPPLLRRYRRAGAGRRAGHGPSFDIPPRPCRPCLGPGCRQLGVPSPDADLQGRQRRRYSLCS